MEDARYWQREALWDVLRVLKAAGVRLELRSARDGRCVRFGIHGREAVEPVVGENGLGVLVREAKLLYQTLGPALFCEEFDESRCGFFEPWACWMSKGPVECPYIMEVLNERSG